MKVMNIKQIEANVVIAVTHDGGAIKQGRVLPMWECDIHKNELEEYAIQVALDFSESIGIGFVEYTVWDFRE